LPYTAEPEKDENPTIDNPSGEQTAEISEENGENQGVYGSTASTASTASIYRIANSDLFGCNNCKLGDRWFMQDHDCSYGNGKRSKLADMVEANQSGNGVMPGYGDGNGNGQDKKEGA